MKSRIFGALALAAAVAACLIFGMLHGTMMAYCGLLLLFVAGLCACACVEAMPNCNEIANRIANFFSED